MCLSGFAKSSNVAQYSVRLVVLTLLLFSSVCGTACTFDADLEQELEHIRLVHNIPVLAVSLLQPCAHSRMFRSVVFGATEGTPLRWGSITKTITALVVLAMAEQDLIDLQAPLSRYVDAQYWQNPWRDDFPVRVIDLLELRAGFTDLSTIEFDYNQPLSLQQALALNPRHRITRWPPGLHHSYSNLVPGLTQLLIETTTQRSYAEVATTLVFAPLAMTSAGFVAVDGLPGGYKADGKTPIPYWHVTFPAFGALNASLSDLQKLLKYLNTSQLRHVQPHLFKPYGRRVGDFFEFDYAAGLYPRIRQGRVWYTHGGDADGYRSRVAFIKGSQLGYVVNINVDNPQVLKQVEALLETYLGTQLQPSKAADDVQANLESYVGSYYPATARFGLQRWQAGRAAVAQIEIVDGQLVFRRGEKLTKLTGVGEALFRRKHDPVATVAFVQLDGHLYIHGELGNFVRLDNCPEYLQHIPQCRKP